MNDATSQADIVAAAECLAREIAAQGPAAHDWSHVARVRAMALRIAHEEAADEFVVELAALLHEVADSKDANADIDTRQWLRSVSVPNPVIDQIDEILVGVSYRGAEVADVRLGLEGRCVRDADRLDALGAIGIARAFTYGGAIGRPIHDPSIAPVGHATYEEYRASRSSTINHFSEKLLLLRDRVETPMGRTIANRRHRVMVEFIDEFMLEWKEGT